MIWDALKVGKTLSWIMIWIFWISILQRTSCEVQLENNPCGFAKWSMYCGCNDDIPEEADEVNCQIFNETRAEDPQWNSFRRLTRIKSLKILMWEGGKLAFFPSRIFQGKKTLETFSLANNVEIEELPPFAFANSDSLVEAKLKTNGLKHLGENSIAYMKNLREVNLGDNKLQEINRGALIGIPNLAKLYLDNNQIQVIHDNAFAHLGNLEVLDLQVNNLTTITIDVFNGLLNLKNLDLRNNGIDLLGPYVFSRMPFLNELELDKNKIISVSPTAFEGLAHLQWLSLKQNKVVVLHDATFQSLARIYFLDLRENELETVSQELMYPIYENLKNESMQLMIEGNRFKCDCRILWIQEISRESRSSTVKENLSRISCDLFFTSHEKRSGRRRESNNVSLVSDNQEETSTFAFESKPSTKRVLDLNRMDFKCEEKAAAAAAAGSISLFRPRWEILVTFAVLLVSILTTT